MTIDAHQHFWRYDSTEYGWIDEEMSSIRRDFLPRDLEAELDAAGVDASVAVQARQNLEETRWLLGLARDSRRIAGVVGWAPLADPKGEGAIRVLARDPLLLGLRHVLQGEADPRYALSDSFDRNLRIAADEGLAYDILIFERQLPQAIELVDRHPRIRFVLDHVAKPRIREGLMSPWREVLSDLGRRPNVWCKLSGMVTEADYHNWTEEGLAPYFEGALRAFGPKRLLFGSDWPVCTVAIAYGRWKAIVEGFAAGLGEGARIAIMGGNAREAYGVGLGRGRT